MLPRSQGPPGFVTEAEAGVLATGGLQDRKPSESSISNRKVYTPPLPYPPPDTMPTIPTIEGYVNMFLGMLERPEAVGTEYMSDMLFEHFGIAKDTTQKRHIERMARMKFIKVNIPGYFQVNWGGIMRLAQKLSIIKKEDYDSWEEDYYDKGKREEGNDIGSGT